MSSILYLNGIRDELLRHTGGQPAALESPEALSQLVEGTRAFSWARAAAGTGRTAKQLRRWFRETFCRYNYRAVSDDDKRVIQAESDRRAEQGLPFDEDFRAHLLGLLEGSYEPVVLNTVLYNAKRMALYHVQGRRSPPKIAGEPE